MRLITELNEDVKVITEEVDGKKKVFIEGIFLQSGIANKNKRIYPEHVMDKEAGRYIQENVQKNKAWGELGHPCFSDSAEILTENGWKKIKEISIGENVYTLNPENRTIELNPTEEVHINHYNGPMYKINNRTFNTLVTPYHKFLVYYRNGKPSQITTQEIKDHMDNDVSILAKFAIPKTANDVSETEEIIKIGEIEYNLETFVSFLALYLAEGCTYKRKDRNSLYKIELFQNEGKKASKIDVLLAEMPLSWNRYSKDGKVVWTSHNKDLAEYLLPLGDSYNKHIPKDILNKINAKLAEKMLEWFVLGDGRGNITKGNREKSDLFSVSEKMIHDFSIVAVKAGYAFHTYTISEFEDVIIENRIIKAENKKPLHFLQLLKTENIYLDKRHLKIEEVPWDGEVYCITVKNGVFLAKDNGYCFWSGNCGPTINFERTSHMIRSLVKEGKNYVGRAEVLNTPMGEIVQELLDKEGNLGVSSRGLGSLRAISGGLNEVMDDFHLATAADIVADPSAPNAFVKGIMEGVEFYYQNGLLKAREIEEIREGIKKAPSRRLNEAKLQAWSRFVNILAENFDHQPRASRSAHQTIGYHDDAYNGPLHKWRDHWLDDFVKENALSKTSDFSKKEIDLVKGEYKKRFG